MKKIIVLLSFMAAVKCFGQTTQTSLISFKTPEVNAFNRLIEVPISQYTGVPNISIPLYEINIKGVNIPIKLDYHAGGIRVDQDATWVGLGWNLSYGGEISRKVRGIPDEYYYLEAGTKPGFGVDYFMKLPNIGPVGNAENQDMRQETIKMAKFGNTDFMPDEFYYSVLGNSGRFMFNQLENKFILFPKDDILITKYAGSARKLDSWNLKLPDGISVDFGKEGYTGQEGRVMASPATIVNSWRIKSVRNNYNDSITYSYDNFSYRMDKISGQEYKIHSVYPSTNETFTSNTLYSDSRLKTITFPGGKMEFVLGESKREDMPGSYLSEINIYNLQNILVKNIRFNYDYFNGDSYEILSMVNPLISNTVSDGYKNKRLKLNSISIKSGVDKPVNYVFDYYTQDKMPSKYSFSQDHWGFYNGIPNMLRSGFIPNLDARFQGGDRSVKPDYSNVFTLKSIVYPEGGKSEFIYENNTAGIQDIPSYLLQTYQDDNFTEKIAGVSVSSYSRNTHQTTPTKIEDRTRFFTKRFTIANGAYPVLNNTGWSVFTNFGISELENNTGYNEDNVYFSLERVNSDGTKTLIKSFNTTPKNFSRGMKRNGVDTAQLIMSPGTFELTAIVRYLNAVNSPADMQPYNLYFAVKWRELDPLKNMINVGGLRIKDINYYDSDNTRIKKKSYKYINPNLDSALPERTSGRLSSFPQYIQFKMNVVDKPRNIYDWIASIGSNSVLPLETTSGSYAGYEYVDEYDVDFLHPKNDLKTSYHFSYVQPYFSEFYAFRANGISDSKEWARGKLLYKNVYNKNAIVKSEVFGYNYWSPHLSNDTKEDYVEEINTDLISFQQVKASCMCNSEMPFPDDFYDVNLETNVNCVIFHYGAFDNHVMSEAHKPDPNGSIPGLTCDYYTRVPYFRHTTAFDKMKSKTITSYDLNGENPIVQIENYNYESTPVHYQLTKTTSDGSAGSTISLVNKYPLDLSLNGAAETGRLKLINNHQINALLSQSKMKNDRTDIIKTDYKVDAVTDLVVPALTKTNTFNNADEIRDVYYRYDNKGNVLSMGKESGLIINYIWSYNGQYPIAEIKNADYSIIESTLGKSSLETFSKSTPDKAAVDGFLEKLKAALPNAQITSYVYNPLVGLVSQTDAKGLTTYFEYDNLQRLKHIKDQFGNIIKRYDYHYKTQ
ncbi:hypothetical protein [Pedobacter cryoconitis]|uniref:hypothetical protein n=1 Tax=Pedobacter cryoconitis TaxID=188932 RepID=UPI00161982F3|nr:hypothetical protein [Pedobacter cryoconitis]MBB5648945.1 hypothetical protein [Pedobacter cryoconitis]